MSLNIPILLGTARPGTYSQHAARFVESEFNKRDGITTFIVDPKDLNLPPDGGPSDGQDPNFHKITAEADGFIIVTPEYNNTFPSTLKRMLDSEYANYWHKPVATISVSDGPWGGVRCAAALAQPLRALGALYLRSTVPIAMCNEVFDENGNIVKNKDFILERLPGVFDDVIEVASAMKAAKQT